MTAWSRKENKQVHVQSRCVMECVRRVTSQAAVDSDLRVAYVENDYAEDV